MVSVTFPMRPGVLSLVFPAFLIWLVGFAPAPAGEVFNENALAALDRAIGNSIKRKKLPGGVLWIAHQGNVSKKAYGNRSTFPANEAMTLDTIFDGASLTKVVATTPCIMKLVEDGTIHLDDKVQKYLPELTGDPNKPQVTIRHLLTHTSGLNSGIRRGYTWSGYENGVALACGETSVGIAGLSYRYSDINFILLGEIVQRVTGAPLDKFATRTVFRPLKMEDTRFRPPASLRARIAPTTRVPDGGVLRGTVHDPTCRAMGGVAGHAGLFTTAADLDRYARMILNRGTLDGVRILEEKTVDLMTGVQSPKIVTARRGLGWDIDSPYAGPRGEHFPLGSFGHTGWTGTSLWIDPASRTFVIFLSNRNHLPAGSVVSLRKDIGTLAAAATGFDFTTLSPKLRPIFKSDEEAFNRELEARRGKVRNGIDVLVARGFAPLEGLKVGLVTNHTGVSRDRTPTIDLLHRARELELAALFSPEHGIRGTLDGKVEDGVDSKTGLPIHSLYAGSTKRKPTPEQLAGLDALVLDLQDIGTRFYTYISTMGLCMEAAGEAGLKFVVLDRVNPIGGESVAGPIRVGGWSFTAFHSIPVRHGMTMGELAHLYRAERFPEVDLTVLPLEGWKRDMIFEETGLPWIDPSPNMRNPTAAMIYPGLGLLEFTNLSVGRGTKLPFELVGAPFINSEELAVEMSKAAIPGLEVIPVHFTPEASKHAGEHCAGLRLLVKDRTAFRAVDFGVALARILRRLYPHHWDTTNLNVLLRHPDTANFLVEGLPLGDIHRSWQPATQRFAARRAKVLLYN